MYKVLIEAADDQDQDVVLQHEELSNNLPRLFAKPGTKKWKGVQIRAQLTRYLSFFGFGQNKKRYGTGIPPPGWPVLVNWRSFEGPSLSCSLPLCSELIFQLLEAQELDPLHHGPHDYQEELLDDDDDVTPVRKRKRASTVVVNENVRYLISQRQEIEERNLPAFERRRRNMEDIEEGLKSLEDVEIYG